MKQHHQKSSQALCIHVFSSGCVPQPLLWPPRCVDHLKLSISVLFYLEMDQAPQGEFDNLPVVGSWKGSHTPTKAGVLLKLLLHDC